MIRIKIYIVLILELGSIFGTQLANKNSIASRKAATKVDMAYFLHIVSLTQEVSTTSIIG